ncbi:amidase [Roseomonas fluvialis]|uniref:Amidase n=1 Tax=Roseomonas fluvialis TaxID=1750527 RepID=A0ABN6PAU6_9PROT|nr:amidase [Roseomonas fluvialis]BDG74756.1 amidase [Roseomonas fluvialis]
MTAPEDMTLAEASAAIKRRRISPVEYLDALRARFDALEPRLNTAIRPLWDEARVEAQKATRRIARSGPRSAIDGLPVGLKDIIDLKGHPTTCHSRHLLDNMKQADAAVVARLRAAGAVFPAKLATHEFAIGGPAFDLPFPPARNPWNTAHHPGGSSSGSGSSVGAGILPAALGTDTGGSVRHPASHCGIVGMKATYGLVSRRGVFPLAFTLDHVGPMTRDVTSNAMLLNAMAGHDPADPGSAAVRAQNYARSLRKGLRGLTIGYVRHFHETDQPATAEVAAALDAAAKLMAKLGAKVKTVTLPRLGDFAGVNRAILMAESAAIHGRWLREAPEGYSNLTRKRLAPGLFVRAEDYVNAQRRRRELVAAVEATLADCDVLLTASSMDPACRIDDPEAVEITYPRQARTPFNVTGHPALTLMCGISQAEGLPLSLQLVGRYFDEATIYRAAAGFEAAAPWKDRRPAL